VSRSVVITRLRDIVPIRPLHRQEALQIAERQATLLLDLLGITDPPVNLQPILDLPRINVRFIRPFPVSGATHWTQGQWSIVLNAAEPSTRQRFSLVHEFKHILDHRFIHIIYSGEKDKRERHRWTEQVCDYFAGCVLIPRPALKRAWTSGIQDLDQLALHFDVSQAAIRTRLGQTGLSNAGRIAGPARHRPVSGSYFRLRRSGRTAHAH
jgi:predicted transcriptional regulator